MRTIILYIGLLLPLALVGCGSSSFLSEAPPTTSETTMDVKSFEAYVTDEGKPEYILRADVAKLSENAGWVALKKIHLTFFKKAKEEKSGTLLADSGLYYFRDVPRRKRKRNDIDLKGNVVFHTADGTTLKTPEVHYTGESGKIYSDAGFEKRRISKEQTIIITGRSFVTDKNLRHWEDTGAQMSFESHKGAIEKEK